jgi:branched-chain amino acid transport system substrate-binding protein
VGRGEGRGGTNKMKKIYIFLSYFFLSFFVTIVMIPNVAISQVPLKVGVLCPFTGRWGDSGRECAKGMLDAGKWLNQRDGVFGRKLEMLLIDDTSQPAETMAAYRKLNEADRILLLYIYSMDTALALVPHIHFDRIPTFTSSLPSHLTTPFKYPYVFSITPTPLDLSKIAMKFIVERSGIKGRKIKVVFVGSPDLYGRHFLDEAKEYAKALGLDIGPDIWISDFSSTKMILPSLSTINQYNPDFAYLSLASKEAFLMLQEAKKMDLKTKWICNMRVFDENLSAFDGVFGVQPISPFGEDVPGMAVIKEAHQRWHPYDSHTLSYIEGWATTQVVAEALGRSLPEQRLSREWVKISLEGFKDFVLGGLIPPITISRDDHRPSVESRIFIIKEGKLSRITSFISLDRERR